MIFNIYLNHLNNRRPSFKIYRDDLFVLVSNAFNITAKVILIVSKALLAHLASVLFIASSLIDTTKELFYLLELRRKHLLPDAFQDNDLPIIHQQHARQQYGYLKQRNTFIINFIASLCLTALVIGCSFFPVGIALTISTCISISIVYLIKTLALHLNEHFYASRLHAELKQISKDYPIQTVNDSNYEQYRKVLQLEEAPLPPVESPQTQQNSSAQARKQPLSHAHSRFFNNTLKIKTPAADELDAQNISSSESIELDALSEQESCSFI